MALTEKETVKLTKEELEILANPTPESMSPDSSPAPVAEHEAQPVAVAVDLTVDPPPAPIVEPFTGGINVTVDPAPAPIVEPVVVVVPAPAPEPVDNDFGEQRIAKELNQRHR